MGAVSANAMSDRATCSIQDAPPTVWQATRHPGLQGSHALDWSTAGSWQTKPAPALSGESVEIAALRRRRRFEPDSASSDSRSAADQLSVGLAVVAPARRDVEHRRAERPAVGQDGARIDLALWLATTVLLARVSHHTSAQRIKSLKLCGSKGMATDPSKPSGQRGATTGANRQAKRARHGGRSARSVPESGSNHQRCVCRSIEPPAATWKSRCARRYTGRDGKSRPPGVLKRPQQHAELRQVQKHAVQHGTHRRAPWPNPRRRAPMGGAGMGMAAVTRLAIRRASWHSGAPVANLKQRLPPSSSQCRAPPINEREPPGPPSP